MHTIDDIHRQKPVSRIARYLLFGTALCMVAVVLGYSFIRQHGPGPAAPTPMKHLPPAKNKRRGSYAMHTGIVTTVFWVGESGDPTTNDNIANRSSAWNGDWQSTYGGIDDPEKRCADYEPCGFTPKENAFYFALPFNDFDETGKRKPAEELRQIPWYTGQEASDRSVVKNRWIAIEYRGKTAFAQWQDVGPFGEDDSAYVFGSARPQEKRAGLDVSPAVASYLGLDGRADTSWHFIDEADVPEGPWKKTITRSQLQY